jgi:hypothetical protein
VLQRPRTAPGDSIKGADEEGVLLVPLTGEYGAAAGVRTRSGERRCYLAIATRLQGMPWSADGERPVRLL